MKLFNKKFFYSLFITTTLFGACTLKLAGMGRLAPEQAGLLAPLQNLSGQCVTERVIKKAFKDTFHLICTMVVYQQNLATSKGWLESQDTKKELVELVRRIKEQINHSYNIDQERSLRLASIAPQPGEQTSYTHSFYYLRIFQTLDTEAEQLHKKMETLVSLLNKEIATGQGRGYLENVMLLRRTVNQAIMWRNMTDSCTIS